MTFCYRVRSKRKFYLLLSLKQVLYLFQGLDGVIIVLLSTGELDIFTTEVDGQILRKAKLHWVFSTLGGEPLAGELSEEGVMECSHFICRGACNVNIVEIIS